MSSAHIRTDFAESFEGGFGIFDDFTDENIGLARVRPSEAFSIFERECRGLGFNP
jgi:hypothetical protein